MVMFTLVLVVYTMVALAIYGEEGVNGRPMHPEGVLQLMLSGLGLLQVRVRCSLVLLQLRARGSQAAQSSSSSFCLLQTVVR